MIDVRALERSEVNPATKMTYADEYRQSLKNRGEDPKWVDKILDLNGKRKAIITQQESLRAEQNKVGEEIARLKRAKEDASGLLTQMQGVGDSLRHKPRVGERGKVYPGDAIGKIGKRVVGGGQRQTRLAAAATAREREQTRVAQ